MNGDDHHIKHARMLLGQGRHDLARGPLREALGQDPDDAEASALLAWCHLQADEYAPATELAQRAIALDPGEPFFHFVLGNVFLDRDMPRDAMRHAEEALRLDPADADHWRLLSSVHGSTKRWRESLDAAERGLSLDAEHAGCSHMRVIALRGLGRGAEAADANRGLLGREPDSAVAHANAGWTCLHRSQIRQAKTHFREALRLDPQMDWAKQGILEAIKATNPIYRVYLHYMLWMATKGAALQWAVIIGAWFGFRFVRTAMANNPSLKARAHAARGRLPRVRTAHLVRAPRLQPHAAGPPARAPRPGPRRPVRRPWASARCLPSRARAGPSTGPPPAPLGFTVGLLALCYAAPVAAVGLARPGTPRLIMALVAAGLLGLVPLVVFGFVGPAFYVMGCALSMLALNFVNSMPAAPKH
jgi:tetratricopeptide (TPR) repeat protein